MTYNDEIPVDSGFEAVSKNNISAAKLLQDYVESYGDKINGLLEPYDSENTEIITNVNNVLKQMSRSLDIIQYKSADPSKVNEIMESIVNDLKSINSRMKIYLEQERELHEERLKNIQNNYNEIWLKISAILDNLISQLSNSLIQKKSLSQKEKEIVWSLVIIREENNKIKDFKNQSFSSQEEMKIYFQNIILKIKGEIINMKTK